MEKDQAPDLDDLKKRVYEIIFEADTPAGKIFDLLLLAVIFSSVVVVMAESVEHIRLRYFDLLHLLEWIFTIFFTIEYCLRLWCVKRPVAYATSAFGIIDLLAVLPAYLQLLLPGSQYLLIIRVMRVLRIFRILKLSQFVREGNIIMAAVRASRIKILVFLTFILLSVTVIGAVMYMVEGHFNESFANIPVSIYWAIVTLTTVGYGDISPVTNLGRILSAIVMIMGYAVIAVPTGIVSAEFARQRQPAPEITTQVCPHCTKEGHDPDAVFCKYCGKSLE